MSIFNYPTKVGDKSGNFNVWQASDGFIKIEIGDKEIKLTLEQIDDLEINCHLLEGYNHEEFVRAYELPF